MRADGIDGPSLASEFLRGVVPSDAGVMARKAGPWLALRDVKGKREDEAEEWGCERCGGYSVAGDVGTDS